MASTNRKTVARPSNPPVAGDWVAHAPGSPEKIYATAASLKTIEALLAEEKVALEDVEVYQVPGPEASTFIGGGELSVLFGQD